MLRVLPMFLLVGAAALGATSSDPARALRHASFCRDSTASVGFVLRSLREKATTTDTLKLRMRNLQFLPATTPDSVQLVTATELCERASRSLRRSEFGVDTGPLQPVHLIRWGNTRYVGSALAPVGEWTGWVVFDTSFVGLIAFTGY